MKSKMTGIILIVVGAIIIGVGVFVFSTSGKQNAVAAGNNSEVTKVVDMPIETIPTVAVGSTDELGRIIEKAISDGFISASERELIKQSAISKGEDHVKVLSDLEKRIKLLESNSEIDEADLKYKKGLDFEKFVVQKFSKRYFKVKEWTGDKYVEGVYAETNQYPDLLMEFFGLNQKKEFAVECKWRQNSVNDGIPFSTNAQLDRYRDYAKKKKVPVFIAIGLGGKGAAPERLFIIPLKDISKPFMFFNQLKPYEAEIRKDFFFDHKKVELTTR